VESFADCWWVRRPRDRKEIRRANVAGDARTSVNDDLAIIGHTRHNYTEKESTRNEALGLSTRSKRHRRQQGRAAQLRLGGPIRKHCCIYRFHYSNSQSSQSGNHSLISVVVCGSDSPKTVSVLRSFYSKGLWKLPDVPTELNSCRRLQLARLVTVSDQLP
jgi:hypothetical protein